MSDLSPVKKILILSANPKGTTPLRLGEEIREIKEGLQRAKRREQFDIESAEAVRYRDIRRAILDYEPEILHFSGHGIGSPAQEIEHDSSDRKLSLVPEYTTESGGLVFEDETGHEKLVNAEALAELFELFSDKLECVVLNACYSEVQGRAIARNIDYVVGMNQAIGDKAAIEFAVGFYDAIGAEKSYEFAYRLGRSAINLAGIPEALTPQFLSKSNIVRKQSIPSFYIERPAIEKKCYAAMKQPGALIRIKAPEEMGKTWLMNKIFADLAKLNYRIVPLNLLQAEETVICELDKFLPWFCTRITRRLGLENQIDNYWDESLSCNDNCTIYFEEYLLANLDAPLVLGLENVDRIFPISAVAPDFFSLLRSWHEDAKVLDPWGKLRLVVAHSTDVYIPLKLDQSPFNVGVSIELSEFNALQVQELAQRYGLDWHNDQVEQLMTIVGGHPYLVDTALTHLATYPDISLEKLLAIVSTEEGIYRRHLRNHWLKLKQEPELVAVMKQIVETDSPVTIASELVFKLDSMGLIRFQGNQVQLRCQLYSSYFRSCLREN